MCRNGQRDQQPRGDAMDGARRVVPEIGQTDRVAGEHVARARQRHQPDAAGAQHNDDEIEQQVNDARRPALPAR